MNKAYGYNKWKDQFERHVKKGEHGITIIAPTPYKKKIEEQKLDPDKMCIRDRTREVVGKCPRCGGEVAELQKGFFCQNDSCRFAIWKNNKWWAAKKKQPTKAVVSALLNDCLLYTS